MASQTGGLTSRSSAVVTAANSIQLAAANNGRQYLLVQNISDVVVYVAFGAAATVGAGSVYLAANGGSIIFEGNQFVPGDTVNAIAASSSGKSVTVLEG